MKEEMKMPGFTAEASLYKPRRQYNLGVSRGADGQVITPQEALYNKDWPMCSSTPLEPGECCYRFIFDGYSHSKFPRLVCSIW